MHDCVLFTSHGHLHDRKKVPTHLYPSIFPYHLISATSRLCTCTYTSYEYVKPMPRIYRSNISLHCFLKGNPTRFFEGVLPLVGNREFFIYFFVGSVMVEPTYGLRGIFLKLRMTVTNPEILIFYAKFSIRYPKKHNFQIFRLVILEARPKSPVSGMKNLEDCT